MKRVGGALTALIVCAGTVVWLTWPLARRAATHLAAPRMFCQFDPLDLTWALAHETRALTHDLS